ncbi:MAG: hypothetical protein JWP45_657 [Mucilaginibacter sp.]|nr:hypothetical protein [Mucilaginibacter sp.]
MDTPDNNKPGAEETIEPAKAADTTKAPVADEATDPAKAADTTKEPDTEQTIGPDKTNDNADNAKKDKKKECPEVTVCPELPLSNSEKTVAGFIMIVAMMLALLVIIIHWPNKMPIADSTIYYNKAFRVTLIENAKPPTVQSPELIAAAAQTAGDKLKADEVTAATLTTAKVTADKAAAADNSADKTASQAAAKKATEAKVAADKIVLADQTAIKTTAAQKNTPVQSVVPPCGTIQFGALILILVAAAGFLGNMVYVASSFATFVGAEKFKRSWILWYVVKPFTASGLAVFLYMALNSSTVMPPVNLNGILAAAALAGLFTDIATQKLKEIFTAAFKPSDNRPDKLTGGKQTVDLANMHPDKIDVNTVNNFLIPGQNLDPKNIAVSINGKKIDAATLTVTPTLIKFPYTVTDKALTTFTLLVTDAKDVKIEGKDMGV